MIASRTEGRGRSIRGARIPLRSAHHFTGTIPLGVSSSTYSRPLPTRPKLAALATASRLSKKGEYLTAQPLNPCVRKWSIVSDCPVGAGLRRTRRTAEQNRDDLETVQGIRISQRRSRREVGLNEDRDCGENRMRWAEVAFRWAAYQPRFLESMFRVNSSLP